MLRNFVKKQDYFTTPDVEKRVYGGIIGLSSYVFVVAYLVYYIINAAMSEYPLSTAVLAFPDTAVDAYTMPPMKCVATNGCIVRSQGGGLAPCRYLAQGESVPESDRKLYYSSDPTESFTVLSTDVNENFALSYDVEKVTKYTNPLETTKIEAAGDFGFYTPMPYKLYRGTSSMGMIETVGVDGSAITTWMNTVTSEVSGFIGTGYCCAATIYNVDGSTNSAKTAAMTGSGCTTGYNSGNGWWGTKINPPTTYTRIAVENPLDVGLIWALIGGWLGFIGTFGSIIYESYEYYFINNNNDDDDDNDNDNNGNNNEGDNTAKFSAAATREREIEITEA